MKFISAFAVLSAIAAVGALVTPAGNDAAPAVEILADAPFVTLIDAPTGLSRDDPEALKAAMEAAGISTATDGENSKAAAKLALYACSRPGFEGMCRWLVYEDVKTCNNVPEWFADTISSMDVFFREVKCNVYNGYMCSVDLFNVTYFNTPKTHLQAGFDNQLRSFYCY